VPSTANQIKYQNTVQTIKDISQDVQIVTTLKERRIRSARSFPLTGSISQSWMSHLPGPSEMDKLHLVTSNDSGNSHLCVFVSVHSKAIATS
jgi:hypothetical protein